MQNEGKKLIEMRVGESAVVNTVETETRLKRRLFELGFTRGAKIQVLMVAPFKSSFLVLVRGSTVALRKNIAALIGVAE